LSPAYYGNPNLEPEEALFYEIGALIKKNKLEISTTLFYRKSENIIDFVREKGTKDPLTAMNIQKLKTKGMEIEAKIFPLKNLIFSFSETILDIESSIPKGMESRYINDSARHKENLNILWQKDFFSTSLSLKSWQRFYKSAHTEIDIAMRWNLKKYNSINFFIEGINISNNPDISFFSSKGPGRWLWAGINYKIF